jgi:hypothetical protein
MHVYEVRPRKDRRGFDLISGVLPFGRLWYDTPDNAIGYVMYCSRSHDAGDSSLRCGWQRDRSAWHNGDFRELYLSVVTEATSNPTIVGNIYDLGDFNQNPSQFCSHVNV